MLSAQHYKPETFQPQSDPGAEPARYSGPAGTGEQGQAEALPLRGRASTRMPVKRWVGTGTWEASSTRTHALATRTVPEILTP